ncbi:MAG: hydroxysqualene dehydroxylase HpnE [Burkholderiales bacterium]
MAGHLTGSAPVAIVGAGYAGMAAAVALAERGVAVEVFEAGPVMGGRARVVRTRGNAYDNGQHLLVGAYRELLGLMRRVGVAEDALLRIPLEIRYTRGFALRALPLPGPLGLLAGLLLARGLRLGERLGVLRFLRALRAQDFRLSEDRSVAALLAGYGQDGTIGRYLWRPLCVAALNIAPERASARAFLAVLRDTLAGPPGASDLLLPRVDLSRLFPKPAAAYVQARGGSVQLRSPVRDLDALRARHARVIVAVGPHQLNTLSPALAFEASYEPIVTVYLQFAERLRLACPMLGLDGALVQWVFDRDALCDEPGRVACVISARGPHLALAHDALAARCDEELRVALPALPPLVGAQVIAEKRATVACTPGAPRPGTRTVLDGVYRAGDYSDPEYPPTLEAAVRSGLRAAQAVLDDLARAPA